MPKRIMNIKTELVVGYVNKQMTVHVQGLLFLRYFKWL